MEDRETEPKGAPLGPCTFFGYLLFFIIAMFIAASHVNNQSLHQTVSTGQDNTTVSWVSQDD